jgi:putative transposase
MSINYAKSSHSVHLLQAHLVFVTKYRRRRLTSRHLSFMELTCRSICESQKSTLVEFNGEADHIHLLVAYRPSLALGTLVRHLKGRSSYTVRKEFADLRWGGNLWSPSYFAASVGGAPVAVLRQYIEGQERPL